MPKVRIIIATLAVVMLLLLPAIAQAQPNVHGFYGTVMLNGKYVEDGTTVIAKIGGEEVATTQTDDSNYSMKVDGDYEGETIGFYVGSAQAPAMETMAWEAGENDNLDLHAYPQGKDRKVTLNPNKGAATNVIGSGFTPGRTAIVSFAGEEIGSAIVNNDGNFYTSIIPTKTGAGDYMVKADDGINSAQATFTVTAGASGSGIESVTVNTLTAGQSASADYNADTGVLTLNIPQGEKGASGAPGPAGEDGDDASSSILAIVALIIAVIAVILAIVFGMRSKQPAAS